MNGHSRGHEGDNYKGVK